MRRNGEGRRKMRVRCERTWSSDESARGRGVDELVEAVRRYVEGKTTNVEVEGNGGDVGEVVEGLRKAKVVASEGRRETRGRMNGLDVVVRVVTEGKGEAKFVGRVEVVPRVIPSTSAPVWVSVMKLPTYVSKLEDLQDRKVGEVYEMTIEASDIEEEGTCWGTDVYTMDSTVSMAAVHAGVAEGGRSNTVYIRVVEGKLAYEGSTRNGVSSEGYGEYNMSYEFLSILPSGELLDRTGVVYSVER